MPPANQGSKAALITWTVISTIFGITMLVVALVMFANRQEADSQLQATQQNYRRIIAATDIQSPIVQDLDAQAQEAGVGQMPLFEYQAQLLQELAQQAAGTAGYREAIAQIQQRIEAVSNLREEDAIQGTNLAQIVDQLVAALQQAEQQIATRDGEIETLQGNLASARQAAEQQAAQFGEELARERDRANEALAQAQAYQEERAQQVRALEGTIGDFQAASQQAVTDMQGRLSAAETSQRQLERQLNEALTRLRTGRVVGDQVLTEPDGRVISAPSQGRVFIDLGRGAGITRGMTFEVYDRVTGIPALREGEMTEPRGKASIEVIRVQDGSSEARIVRTTPGQSIREGDIIANLIYDRNVPLQFYVYGRFNLDNQGIPSDRDRQRLEALVNEFGGNLADQISVTTDVVVLGVEPEVPSFTPEQQRDPAIQAQLVEAQQRRAQYLQVLSRAQELQIPVLNQNQFLYLTGYFEQARQ